MLAPSAIYWRWFANVARLLLTLLQQLLGVGGLLALRLEESVDALPDQVLPARPARRSQCTRFYGDDLPWNGGRPHTTRNTFSTLDRLLQQPLLRSRLAHDFLHSQILSSAAGCRFRTLKGLRSRLGFRVFRQSWITLVSCRKRFSVRTGLRDASAF